MAVQRRDSQSIKGPALITQCNTRELRVTYTDDFRDGIAGRQTSPRSATSPNSEAFITDSGIARHGTPFHKHPRPRSSTQSRSHVQRKPWTPPDVLCGEGGHTSAIARQLVPVFGGTTRRTFKETPHGYVDGGTAGEGRGRKGADHRTIARISGSENLSPPRQALPPVPTRTPDTLLIPLLPQCSPIVRLRRLESVPCGAGVGCVRRVCACVPVSEVPVAGTAMDRGAPA